MKYALLIMLSGCTMGVPREAVSEATTTISTQVQLSKAALAKCQEGDKDLCARLGLNLDNINGVNSSLRELAQ